MTVAPAPLLLVRRNGVPGPSARHRRRPLATFGAVALAVFLVDAGTKGLASLLAAHSMTLGDWARSTLLRNHLLTGGVSLGAFTALGHVAVLVPLIGLMVLVCRPLSEVDDAAPVWLGLLAGAALGNGIEVVAAGGATDFLALRYAEGAEVVGNMADVAAGAGLALLVRSLYRIASAMRHAPVATTSTRADRVRAPAPREVAVPLLVYDDTTTRPTSGDEGEESWRRRPAAAAAHRAAFGDLAPEPDGDAAGVRVAD